MIGGCKIGERKVRGFEGGVERKVGSPLVELQVSTKNLVTPMLTHQ